MSNSSTANLVNVEGGPAGERPPQEYNPHKHRELEHPTTDLETLVHLLKGSLGSGIMAMPQAFANAGLVCGLVATILIGCIATYCVNILVASATFLCQRRKLPSLDFHAVAEVAFLEGPQRLRKYAPLARFTVNFFLVADLFGTCCVYIVFVCSNLKEVLDLYTPYAISLRMYMLCTLPFLLIINSIRNLKYLAPLSMVANVCIAMGLAITLYYILLDLPPLTSRPAFVSITKLPLFFGTAIFALEGVGVVMPLENNMKTPEHFLGCPGVLNIGMSVVVSLYAILGFLGYLRYGDATEASITLNLPDAPLAQSVKVMIALAMFFTYALQFYVPVNVILNAVKHKFPNHPVRTEYVIRYSLVVLSVVVAIAEPNLSPLMSLVGAVTLSSLGLLFPSVVELVVYWDVPGGLGKFNWVIWKNVLVIMFGLLGFLTGAYSSILEIIETYDS